MKSNSILTALQGAKLTLLRCEKDRLAGIRTSLDDTRRQPISLDQLERATVYDLAIRSIEDARTRHVVELAATVDRGGERLYSRAQIAAILRCSEKTVTRALAKGLKAVESFLFHAVSRETKFHLGPAQ